MLTPAQVAQRANITAQSIRNYSRDYGELLSSQARGNDGPRLYTDEDVQILCTVADLRKAGVSRAEIIARIRDEQAPPIIEGVATTLNENPQTLKTALNEAFAPLAIQSSVLARFDAIERRLDTRDRQAMLWHIGTGIWIGMVLMGSIFLAVWLAVNGV